MNSGVVYYLLLIAAAAATVASFASTEEEEDGFCSIKDEDCRWREEFMYKYRKGSKDYVDDSCFSSSSSKENCGPNSCHVDLIRRDLAVFKDFINETDLKAARELVPGSVTYQIIRGRIFRSSDCMFPSRCAGIEHFLLQVKDDDLKDIEFVVNTHDWPYVNKYFYIGNSPPPVFSFSKTPDYYDITFPAWTFWEGGPAINLYPRGLGRWDLMRKTLMDTDIPWNEKTSKAFFRGSRTSKERDNLVLLSRKHPELIDAQYTKNQAWKSPADSLGVIPAEEVDLPDHCQYKYLFNFRGVAASFRFKHLFLCGSLVFHVVGDEWIEFFYPSMKPWVHYIPVPASASQSEIRNLIKFAMENDEIAKEIADRGFKFIRDHLRMEDVICYWKILLQNYSELFSTDFRFLRNPDFVEIKEVA